MNHTQGIPAAPSDRDLPDHRRTREELLMKIGSENSSENRGASLRRRWGVPLCVAAGVAAMSVGAVTVLGGTGGAKPLLADPAGNPTRAATPRPDTAHGSTSKGAGPTSPSAPAKSAPHTSFSVTSAKTTPIDAGTVRKILASCLGRNAQRFHPVAAVRAPVSSQDQDGVVIAVDADGQYVQCVAKGDKGRSDSSPPTFINDRLWGTGRKIAYFNTTGTPVGKGKYLMVGAGHYTSDVSRITISYGDNPKQYPVVMAGGAFVYAAALSADQPDRDDAGPSPYVHAYSASGEEMYNQKKDPQFSDAP
jgi:hypothetical protein